MQSHQRRWRSSPVAVWIVVGLIILIAAGRLYLPQVVERYVNRQLNRQPEYGGRIGNVHIQLWRGRYRIDQPYIFNKTGGTDVPLFAADQVFLSVEWRELFHGSIVGVIKMERPRLNFVAGPTGEETQTGKDANWSDTLESLSPFKLNRFEIHDGQIHFQNEHSTPPVDIYLNHCSVVATNLSNSRDLKTQLPAGVIVHGTSVGGGGLDINIQIDPLASAPTYELTAQLTNVDLTALNDFLKAYGKFDVAHGKFALFTSIASKDGRYDGYAKVFFSNLNVFAWEKERKKDALEIFWQAIVGTLADAFKNQNHDDLATRIPISGEYGREKIGTWAAVGSLLRNAFIKALVPKLDENVTVNNVEKKSKTEQKPANPGNPAPHERGAQALVPTGQ